MTKSESIAKLAEALAKAQNEYEVIEKNCVNPYFKSRYADLSAIIDATRSALARNGLSYTQIASLAPPDAVIVNTTLMHASGEWIAGEFAMPVMKFDAQGVGSALTYGRRYALQSILGVSAEADDDANEASGKSDEKKPVKKESAKADDSQPALRRVHTKFTQVVGGGDPKNCEIVEWMVDGKAVNARCWEKKLWNACRDLQFHEGRILLQQSKDGKYWNIVDVLEVEGVPYKDGKIREADKVPF